MSNETLVKSDNKKEAKGKRAEFQKARPLAEGKTTVIHVARTAKVVKGGKRFGFRALVVVGNGMGKVGVAIGKANQVQLAIAKAESHARKHMITFPISGETIPHEVIGKFGAASVWMKPAAPGTGVIAGSGARLLFEAAGIKDVLAKSLGSSNPCNLVYATMEAFNQLKSKEAVNVIRGEAEKAAAEAPKAEVKAEAAKAE